jgi:hypothetical protein
MNKNAEQRPERKHSMEVTETLENIERKSLPNVEEWKR